MAPAEPTRIPLVFSLLALLAALFACAPETPPKPERADRPAAAGEAGADADAASWDPSLAAVLTFAGERGAFQDAKAADAIPEASKGLVRVTLLDGPAPPPGKVWVGNFKNVDAEGKVALETVDRDAFEELALGQGLSSTVELPDTLEPPAQAAPSTGGIVVYKTAWCGVCKKLEGYLKRKGVAYESKDIEKDPQAAAELRSKAAGKGVKTGSVPVIDVRGELIVGFDRARLEKIL